MFFTLWNADKNVSLLIYQHIAQYWHKCLISIDLFSYFNDTDAFKLFKISYMT